MLKENSSVSSLSLVLLSSFDSIVSNVGVGFSIVCVFLTFFLVYFLCFELDFSETSIFSVFPKENDDTSSSSLFSSGATENPAKSSAFFSYFFKLFKNSSGFSTSSFDFSNSFNFLLTKSSSISSKSSN